ncbi:MAG TPA: ATP synthase F1 subunit delta [Puia sp.]|nr:ATP synthase F1 subunit delta [Puia sp.]
MLPNPRLAARYAKSILDLAIEKGQLEAVYKDMLLLQDICRSSRDFVGLLRSPVIKADKKGKILDAILGGRVSALTAAFTKLLLTKEREGSLPEIAGAFVDQYKEYKGIQTVRLTTAVPVSESVRKAILDKVRSGSQAREIELNTEVDEDLIGGFILEIGDRMVDGSVAYELNHIRQQFENNDFIYKIR